MNDYDSENNRKKGPTQIKVQCWRFIDTIYKTYLTEKQKISAITNRNSSIKILHKNTRILFQFLNPYECMFIGKKIQNNERKFVQ